MKNRKKIAGMLIVNIIFSMILPMHAGSWNWTRPYKMPEKNIQTLIMVANYRTPRLLADLVQSETKQPILVVPASAEGNIYFMPADRNDKTMKIKLADLTDFIKFVNPEKIIVLGNQKHVPNKYLNVIDPKQTVITVTNKDWAMVAKSVSRILDLKYLIRDFRTQQALLKSGQLYRPNSTTSNNIVPPPNVEDIVTEDKITENIIIEDKIETEKSEPANTLEEPKLIDESMVVPK